MNKTVKINVPPPAGISNINIPPVQSANRVNPFFKSSGDLVGALDDEHLNTIEAHDPQKLINIGTVDTPIMVSANRTKEFKSSLQLLIKKYPEPFLPGLGEFKGFSAKIEYTDQIPLIVSNHFDQIGSGTPFNERTWVAGGF